MVAHDNLSPDQFSRTLHRGMHVLVPTSEIQPHLDRGDHEAAADVVMHHVLNYQETRPNENAHGRQGGLGTHWSDVRSATERFSGTKVGRDSSKEFGDDMTIPVVLRGVVHPDAIDHTPPEHRAVWGHTVENEVPLRSGANISLRSAHVRLPEATPALEPVLDWHQGEAPASKVIKRRYNRDATA